MLYNYSYNVEVVIIDYTDPGAVPGTSTNKRLWCW